jgi:hypothetical protein
MPVKSIYRLFVERLPVRPITHDHSLHTLSAEETARMQQVERRTRWISAGIAAVMVLLLYVPQYIFPDFFAGVPTRIPFTSISFAIPWWSIVWCIFLIFLEIVLLTFLHLYCSHEVAVATGLITQSTPKDNSDLETLVAIGMERKDKSITAFGLNPYQGLSPSAIFIRNLIITLKATLTNPLVKLLMRWIFGKYAHRIVLDMIGIPIFAFWNAWATHVIMRESRLVIMGRNFVQQLKFRIPKKIDPEHHALLYDTLQFIAVSKRDYHRNHLYLTHMLFGHYGIERRERHEIDHGYDDRLEAAPEEVRKLCMLIIILGFLLDGSISMRELLRAEQLRRHHLLDLNLETLYRYRNDFYEGRGLEPLLKHFLD